MDTNRDRKSFESRRKNSKIVQTRTVNVFDRVQAFRDPLRGEIPHFQILMNDGPNPLT